MRIFQGLVFREVHPMGGSWADVGREHEISWEMPLSLHLETCRQHPQATVTTLTAHILFDVYSLSRDSIASRDEPETPKVYEPHISSHPLPSSKKNGIVEEP